MSILKAPYNFVPLNEQVVCPYWAPYVSHDIPFEDSCSGTLEVTLTARSPIFVKDGVGQRGEAEYYNNGTQIKPYRFNRDEQGRYFIPGSSIKGMVRNVLEVLSFGKMENKVTDRKYALRDLSSTMKDEYLQHFKPDKIYGGWLRKDSNNRYVLNDCGLPGRIKHSEIDNKLGTTFSTYFTPVGQFNPREDSEKAAKRKYDLFDNRKRQHRFTFDYDDANRQVYIIDNKAGSYKGTLVFTGQPGPRKQKENQTWTGHVLEFIFWDRDKVIPVEESVIRDFKDAYYEYDKTEWSVDWKMRRQELEEGRSIPVFFSKDDNGRVKHLGLSYLYKLPYRHSVREAIEQVQREKGIDLSEALFGYVPEAGTGLKGRVHIGPAFGVGAIEEGAERQDVLSSPKASYFPHYIRQEINNGRVRKYVSYMNKRPEIAGWKRYPVHARGVRHNGAPQGNEKIVTRFKPLEQGARFSCRIRYHNLKEIELGALLSALTFHQTDETYHSLGMAKPLGYGKVEVRVSGIEEPEKYLRAFECFMNMQLDNDLPYWHQSEQVVELVTMAQEQVNEGAAALEYVQPVKKFVEAKNKREALDRYSRLVRRKAGITPLSTPDCIRAMQKQCAEEKERLAFFRPLSELAKEQEEQTRSALAEQLEKQKRELLQNLEAKRTALRKAAEAKRREEEEAARRKALEDRRQCAIEQGLVLDQVHQTTAKKAFDQLKKEVEVYLRDYYGAAGRPSKADGTGQLPERDHAVIVEALAQIHERLGKKDAAKWQKPFDKNPILKKAAEWVGEEKARAIQFPS